MLIARAAPAFSSSIWIAPMPPPTSSTVRPSTPSFLTTSKIRRDVASRPLRRYRFASARADLSLNTHRYPFGVQQSLMTRLGRRADGGNHCPEKRSPHDQEDPGNEPEHRHAKVDVTEHEPGDRHPPAGLARLLDLVSGHVPEDHGQDPSEKRAEQPGQDAAH